MITIRKGNESDIGAIMDCYAKAKQIMRRAGNHNQWTGGYPSRGLVASDINRGVNFVGSDESGEIVMAFAFIIGLDATYAHIEDGSWLDDSPYGTIHRLASNGRHHGIFKACADYCNSKISNLRIDTHADNHIMQKAAHKLGFKRCGIIYIDDGTPRIAYQRHIYK